MPAVVLWQLRTSGMLPKVLIETRKDIPVESTLPRRPGKPFYMVSYKRDLSMY